MPKFRWSRVQREQLHLVRIEQRKPAHMNVFRSDRIQSKRIMQIKQHILHCSHLLGSVGSRRHQTRGTFYREYFETVPAYFELAADAPFSFVFLFTTMKSILSLSRFSTLLHGSSEFFGIGRRRDTQSGMRSILFAPRKSINFYRKR